MDAIDTQLTQLTEEIDAMKKERTEAKKALERAIEADKSERVMASLQSLFDGATTELKQLRKKEVELMRQKDRRTAVIEAKQGSRSSSDSSLSIKDSSPQSIASDSMDVDVRWKDEVPPVYSLKEAKLFFVNRSAAVEQLQKIHGFKFHRATSNEGKEWIIPIADNVIGLGKSAFGRHYIRKSRESWPTATEIGSFEKTLCDCHTIVIEFHKGALLEDTFDAVMIRFLCKALKGMFVVQPAILSKPPKTVNAFLDDLTEVAGPVFIVLDEIGKAFQANALDDFQQRDQFYSFCQIILDKWLPLKNVFFVVLGRASFLNYVALRPTNACITPSPYVFERLNIHLLRPPSIRTIMDKTCISSTSTGSDTIAARLELTQQTSEAVAEHLFRQTNGHPRSLLDAFESCHSVDELLQYHKPLEMLNWKEFYEKLVLNEAAVTRLLNYVESGDTIDLTEPIDDAGKKRVTLDNIASNSFIAWEGTVLEAKLYLHPTVKMYMENYFMPFREYLKRIGNMTRVSIDFPTVFEWMFLKRFQEIFFQAPNEPRLALPAFFGTPKFGNYTSVSFSKSVRPIPKITSAGSASASLDSDTARPAAWPSLLDSIGPGPICLKPLSKSASSDAFLIGSAKFGAESFVLTVGLAVKNYVTTAFSWSHLSRECFVFNRMFEGANLRESFFDVGNRSLKQANIGSEMTLECANPLLLGSDRLAALFKQKQLPVLVANVRRLWGGEQHIPSVKVHESRKSSDPFLDIRKSLQRQNILILCEFGMEDGSDAFMLDYIVESLRQSSARSDSHRYIIVTGSNDFTAAFIHGMGSREMVEKNHVYIGTNYPMPFENATLLYGSRYFELIRGFVLVSCANSDTSRPTFQEGRQELIRLSGYNFTDNDVIYNALDSFYDCAMNMDSGWNLLLPDSSILDLSTKNLNHLMNYSLFKNMGYHGMITDPFILTEQGDWQNPWNACAMTGNEYECVPFGHTDVYMTAFSADRNTTSGFWRGVVEFPGDGAEKRIIAFLSAAKGVGTVITVLIILGIIFALFLSFILWRSKDHPAVKALSLPEATISLMGAVVSYASLLFYLGEFNKLFCKLRISMFLLGFSMIMSAMVFRSALMILMFGKKRVRKPALLARRIRAANAITIAVEFIFLAGWISRER
ncbi:hypothetical protein BJ741DRAFT_585176 [Chytriomyces cf. hyalinus JEL632]|nr:hypothetical protein BJ741DRAFT_585176 [Chytriomyces cf. hyalinus JEL632]